MTIIFLIAAAVFGLLAADAWRISRPRYELPYQLEAAERGESVAGVPVSEQLRRQSWHRRYGFGALGHSVWLWLILAFGCLLAALVQEFR